MLGGEGFPSFSQEKHHHGEGGCGIGPPPAERRVEDEADEHDGGQPGAGSTLSAVRFNSPTAEREGDPSFASGEQWTFAARRLSRPHAR